MGSKKKNIYGPQKTKNNKLIYKKIGPNITGIQKEWIDKIVALGMGRIGIVPVSSIKKAFNKGPTELKNLWTKIKEDNKKFGEEKTWIAQHRKKKRHSQSPTHDQPLEQGSGAIKKYAKGGGVRKANYK